MGCKGYDVRFASDASAEVAGVVAVSTGTDVATERASVASMWVEGSVVTIANWSCGVDCNSSNVERMLWVVD